MSDLNKEALDIWGGLKPMIDQEISSRTQGMVQRRKAKVTTAPSLATNTIGVTEAFGQEIFLPFVSNMISAKVGDFVWIEWMYGATNAFVSSYAAADDKNISVAGVLDVVSRRCYGPIPTSGNSAGWYKVMDFTGWSSTAPRWSISLAIDFTITREYNNNNNEIHRVSLISTYNSTSFANETSKSNSMLIDKIRYVFDGNNGHVDIHYNTSSSNTCIVDFLAHFDPTKQDAFVAVTPTAVADSPSGTVVTEYSFAANTECEGSFTAGAYTESFLSGTYLYRQGKIVTGFIKAKMNASVPASGWRGIAVVPVGFRPYYSIDFFAMNSSTSESIQARIETSTGNVSIWPYSAIASGTAIYLSFTYYTG